MRQRVCLLVSAFTCVVLAASTSRAQKHTAAPRQLESLDRGIVAVHQGEGKVFVSWRLLATDPGGIAFNLYRATSDGEPIKVNADPITSSTNFADSGVDISKSNAYTVRPLIDGKEQPADKSFVLPANAPVRQYLSIPLKTPEGYTPGDASVGDLDGDGQYEIVVKAEQRPQDNSRGGTTGQTKLEAYKLDGTFLWRIDLGKNIREGAHYTQFIVYDLDGDGCAEVACKTADGTIDGAGTAIGNADADHRNAAGYVLDGPEFLTIFDGKTGRALATADYIPPRGNVAAWGDDYGNRVDRFLACVAYLDGRRPSLVMCRGYYTRAVLAAWDWRDGKLAHRWTFDSDDGTPGNRNYRGQGNHNLAVGDVDGDGKDEIVYGAGCIDDDGRGLYSTGLGHGDAMHLSDIDPARPGLEVFQIHERPRHENGMELHDAASGKLLWGIRSPDAVRGVTMDVDPRHHGYECWGAGAGLRGLFNCRGERISQRSPRSCNFGVWWDGDLLRELLDRNAISKWNWTDESETRLLTADGCVSNNGSKATPALCADIFGDWREEVIWRTEGNRELRIYMTTIPTDRRLVTLMHDPIYRLSVAWQNVAYNQPTQTGFYLGGRNAVVTRESTMTVAHKTAAVQNVVPLLFVEDMDCSLAFYRDQLGFQMTEKWEPEGKIAWCRLVRGGAAVMLQQACDEDGPTAGRGRGVGFFFQCDNADAIHIELCANGLLLDPPTVAFYGMRQLFFKDPDGYELCFQSRVAS